MSRRAIDRSPELTRLREAGYEIQFHPSGHVLVNNVPYVAPDGSVAYGSLIVAIDEQRGDMVGRPGNHQAYFRGDFPHKRAGLPLDVLRYQSAEVPLGGGLVAQHYFSYKSDKIQPDARYADYYDLVTSYVDLIERYAKRVDPKVTALTGRAFDLEDNDAGPFLYRDTAPTRSGIVAVSERLANHVVAIIGLGGTGSYVLDFESKTPVSEIRLYDGDRFSQHNAFRSPGAAAIADVAAVPPINRVDYYRDRYCVMRRGIEAHPVFVDRVGDDFSGVDFVFLCLDNAPAKKPIVDGLIALDKPFIDVGMGVVLEETSLGGAVRTTFSAPGNREHRHPIQFVDVADEYATNIQIAELNPLNAALAVIRWKKHLGFYRSMAPEYSSVYWIEYNDICNSVGRGG